MSEEVPESPHFGPEPLKNIIYYRNGQARSLHRDCNMGIFTDQSKASIGEQGCNAATHSIVKATKTVFFRTQNCHILIILVALVKTAFFY
jgi:hypothetical protein